MASYEELPTYNIETSLEKVGFTDIQKVELNEQYLAWAKENLEPEVFTALKENYESLDVHKYRYHSDGLAIAGYLWTPKNIDRPLQLIVWNRGGTGEYGSTGERIGTPYTSFACELARLNSVVIGSEYRGGVDSEGHDEHGGTDLNDVVTLKALADSLPFVAPKRALVVGESRGGMMSYKLATKADWIKGVISLSGTTDLISSAEEDPGMKKVYLKSFGGSEDEMRKRSAVHFYKKIPHNLPLLILQGAKDERVSVEQVRALHTLLKESNHMVEYHEFPEGDHGFYSQSSQYREEVNSIIKDFIQKHHSD